MGWFLYSSIWFHPEESLISIQLIIGTKYLEKIFQVSGSGIYNQAVMGVYYINVRKSPYISTYFSSSDKWWERAICYFCIMTTLFIVSFSYIYIPPFMEPKTSSSYHSRYQPDPELLSFTRYYLQIIQRGTEGSFQSHLSHYAVLYPRAA